jgi:hypothetical protein
MNLKREAKLLVYRKKKYKQALSPVKNNGLLAVHVQTAADRAAQRGLFEQALLIGTVFPRRHGESYFHPDYPAGCCPHYFVDRGLRSLDVYAVVAGSDAHDGHHAGGQGRGDEVRGGEGLSPALVVNGGIGVDLGTGAQMGAGGAQLAVVYYF